MPRLSPASASLRACLATALRLYPQAAARRRAEHARTSPDFQSEATPSDTAAYAQLLFARAAARLGDRPSSTRLLRAAHAHLSSRDFIHEALLLAFTERIHQASQGLPDETPLGLAAHRRLADLPPDARYKFDRVRELSLVLEPLETVDAVRCLKLGLPEPAGLPIRELRLSRPRDLSPRLAALLQSAGRARHPERDARTLGGLLPFLARLPRAEARVLLASVVRVLSRHRLPTELRLLEQCLLLGLLLDDRPSIDSVIDRLCLRSRGKATALLALLPRLLSRLRTAGLPAPALALAETVTRRRALHAPAHSPARLGLALASGLCGHPERTAAAIDDALDHLEGEVRLRQDRVWLARAIAFSLTALPQPAAWPILARLTRTVAGTWDTFTTSTHLCVTALGVLEAVALGHEVAALGVGAPLVPVRPQR